ncbi:MAG: class I SAM-dependent methyltransferase [Burkholderiales bacterium]
MTDVRTNFPHHQTDTNTETGTGTAIFLPAHSWANSGLAPEWNDLGDLLRRLFDHVNGCVALRLWNGSTLRLGRLRHARRSADFTLVCHEPRTVLSLLLRSDPLRFAEAYFRCELDVEGDFFAAVNLKEALEGMKVRMIDKLQAIKVAWRLRRAIKHQKKTNSSTSVHILKQAQAVKFHSPLESRQAIAFHYDVSNYFYALWLDEAMVYSCAYFQSPQDPLSQAQCAKLDLICRKLLLKPGDIFLDIGCGWGALILHAARHYGVRANGITLSEQQLDHVQKRVIQEGLQGQVAVALADYRDLSGLACYDKIASVGMFEHVGLKNLQTYFATVHRLLKPGGLFLNHGITHDIEGWKKTLSTEFINRYIFPDGQLDTIGNIQRAMERSGFEIADLESLRPHYALTLRHWVHRLERQHTQALKYVSESVYRTWRLYMAACALEFETGEIGIYQVLAGKRARRPLQTPLTRRHMLLKDIPVLHEIADFQVL